MRFTEFKRPLQIIREFEEGDFVTPEVDILGPLDPETASINKQNALTLLQMDPDPSALAEVAKLLSKFRVNPAPEADLDQTAQAISNVAATTAAASEVPAPAEVPAAPEQDVNAEQPVQGLEPEEEDSEEELTEGVRAQNAAAKVAALDENDPEQQELLARIEAILESKKIEPVIVGIIKKKFTFHLNEIIDAVKNAIVSVKVALAEKVKFLNLLKAGVFDMQSIKTKPEGNLYAGISGPIFDAIKDPIFKIEFGTGGNKLGKGEALLAIISKGAFKGERGDIQLASGEEIEVKASSGDKGPTGAVLVALGKGESEDGKRSKESAYGANTEAGKKFKALIAKAYSTRTYPIKEEQVPNSITGISVAKFFNPFILKAPARALTTANALKEAYKIIFKKAKDPAFFAQLDECVTGDGIDIDLLVRTVRSMEFDYYKTVIKHDAILFINGTTGTYRYIEDGNALFNQLATTSKGSNLYSTGVIDFSGTYGNGFGKIFTK